MTIGPSNAGVSTIKTSLKVRPMSISPVFVPPLRHSNFFLDVIQKRIEDETEWETVSDLSDEDVHRGMNVFLIYREFLEDYARNPDKYSKRDYYEIPWRIEGK